MQLNRHRDGSLTAGTVRSGWVRSGRGGLAVRVLWRVVGRPENESLPPRVCPKNRAVDGVVHSSFSGGAKRGAVPRSGTPVPHGVPQCLPPIPSGEGIPDAIGD